MEDFRAWHMVLGLLKRMEWQPIGRKFDTGDRQEICSACSGKKFEGHNDGCELQLAIKEIDKIVNDEMEKRSLNFNGLIWPTTVLCRTPRN